MSDAIERIVKVLSDDNSHDDHKYYVYGLFIDNRLIYIGKGTGYRVVSHEIDAEGIKNDIRNDIELSKEEKEIAIDNLSDKEKEIILAKNSNIPIEKVIIKWGLTEQEAFMAESALINLCNYININKKSLKNLTNIVNGHASDKEKNSRINTTQAMNVDEFAAEVAFEQLTNEDIGEDTIVFVKVDDSIKKYYEQMSTEAKNDSIYWNSNIIKECVFGCWRLDVDRVKKADYLLAIGNNNIVRGIYEFKDFSKMSNVDENIFNEDIAFRRRDKIQTQILKKYGVNVSQEFLSIKSSENNLTTDITIDELEKYKNRGVFLGIKDISTKDIGKKYINHEILYKKDGKDIMKNENQHYINC